MSNPRKSLPPVIVDGSIKYNDVVYQCLRALPQGGYVAFMNEHRGMQVFLCRLDADFNLQAKVAIEYGITEVSWMLIGSHHVAVYLDYARSTKMNLQHGWGNDHCLSKNTVSIFDLNHLQAPARDIIFSSLPDCPFKVERLGDDENFFAILADHHVKKSLYLVNLADTNNPVVKLGNFSDEIQFAYINPNVWYVLYNQKMVSFGVNLENWGNPNKSILSKSQPILVAKQKAKSVEPSRLYFTEDKHCLLVHTAELRGHDMYQQLAFYKIIDSGWTLVKSVELKAQSIEQILFLRQADNALVYENNAQIYILEDASETPRKIFEFGALVEGAHFIELIQNVDDELIANHFGYHKWNGTLAVSSIQTLKLAPQIEAKVEKALAEQLRPDCTDIVLDYYAPLYNQAKKITDLVKFPLFANKSSYVIVKNKDGLPVNVELYFKEGPENFVLTFAKNQTERHVQMGFDHAAVFELYPNVDVNDLLLKSKAGEIVPLNVIDEVHLVRARRTVSVIKKPELEAMQTYPGHVCILPKYFKTV